MRGLSFAVLLLGSACADEELPRFGTLQYQSDNFEVSASDGLVACDGTFGYMEGWLAAFRSRMGRLADNEPYTFYWLDEGEFQASSCPFPTGACTHAKANVIYSTLIPMSHEVVHAEIALGEPASLLREGVAELFGSIRADNLMVDLDPLFDEEQMPSDAYQTAGRFSRFLMDRYGQEAYLGLHERLDGTYGREPFANAVRSILGADLSDLETDFDEAYASCTIDRWRIYDYECSALPLIDWTREGTWSEEVDLSCGNDRVIGPRDGVIWTLRAFEVEATRTMVLTIDSPDETASARIFDCNASCEGPYVPQVARSASVAQGGRSANAAYEAGRYWVLIGHRQDSDAQVIVGLE